MQSRDWQFDSSVTRP
nr:unnamed protein product [Callosobruchus chinensis]